MVFLNKLKDSNAIPTLEDLRPITISSLFVKIIEAITLQRLKWLPEYCTSLSPNQLGFREECETGMHLIKLMGDLNLGGGGGGGNNNNNSCYDEKYLLFIDFKGAFDTVPHDLLFNKLE